MANKVLNIDKIVNLMNGIVEVDTSKGLNYCPNYGELLNGSIVPYATEGNAGIIVTGYSVGDSSKSYSNQQLVCETDVDAILTSILIITGIKDCTIEISGLETKTSTTDSIEFQVVIGSKHTIKITKPSIYSISNETTSYLIKSTEVTFTPNIIASSTSYTPYNDEFTMSAEPMSIAIELVEIVNHDCDYTLSIVSGDGTINGKNVVFNSKNTSKDNQKTIRYKATHANDTKVNLEGSVIQDKLSPSTLVIITEPYSQVDLGDGEKKDIPETGKISLEVLTDTTYNITITKRSEYSINGPFNDNISYLTTSWSPSGVSSKVKTYEVLTTSITVDENVEILNLPLTSNTSDTNYKLTITEGSDYGKVENNTSIKFNEVNRTETTRTIKGTISNDGASNTFSVTQNKVQAYTLTVKSNIEGGTVSANTKTATVKNDVATFTINGGEQVTVNSPSKSSIGFETGYLGLTRSVDTLTFSSGASTSQDVTIKSYSRTESGITYTSNSTSFTMSDANKEITLNTTSTDVAATDWQPLSNTVSVTTPINGFSVSEAAKTGSECTFTITSPSEEKDTDQTATFTFTSNNSNFNNISVVCIKQKTIREVFKGYAVKITEFSYPKVAASGGTNINPNITYEVYEIYENSSTKQITSSKTDTVTVNQAYENLGGSVTSAEINTKTGAITSIDSLGKTIKYSDEKLFNIKVTLTPTVSSYTSTTAETWVTQEKNIPSETNYHVVLGFSNEASFQDLKPSQTIQSSGGITEKLCAFFVHDVEFTSGAKTTDLYEKIDNIVLS